MESFNLNLQALSSLGFLDELKLDITNTLEQFGTVSYSRVSRVYNNKLQSLTLRICQEGDNFWNLTNYSVKISTDCVMYTNEISKCIKDLMEKEYEGEKLLESLNEVEAFANNIMENCETLEKGYGLISAELRDILWDLRECKDNVESDLSTAEQKTNHYYQKADRRDTQTAIATMVASAGIILAPFTGLISLSVSAVALPAAFAGKMSRIKLTTKAELSERNCENLSKVYEYIVHIDNKVTDVCTKVRFFENFWSEQLSIIRSIKDRMNIRPHRTVKMSPHTGTFLIENWERVTEKFQGYTNFVRYKLLEFTRKFYISSYVTSIKKGLILVIYIN
jgi:hypothetical protein